MAERVHSYAVAKDLLEQGVLTPDQVRALTAKGTFKEDPNKREYGVDQVAYEKLQELADTINAQTKAFYFRISGMSKVKPKPS